MNSAKILYWNCRGILARETSSRVFRLIRTHNPLLFVLLKPEPALTVLTASVKKSLKTGIGLRSWLMVYLEVSLCSGTGSLGRSPLLPLFVGLYTSWFRLILLKTFSFMWFITRFAFVTSAFFGMSFPKSLLCISLSSSWGTSTLSSLGPSIREVLFRIMIGKLIFFLMSLKRIIFKT